MPVLQRTIRDSRLKSLVAIYFNRSPHCKLAKLLGSAGVSDRSSQDEFCFTSDHDQLATKVRESLETLESPTTIPARFVSVVRECRKQRCQPH
jgi:hypothetical protein